MSSNWYCSDCETHIDADAIESHEAEGHSVRGVVRPDRLLGSDPWEIGVHQRGGDGSAEDDAVEDGEVTD